MGQTSTIVISALTGGGMGAIITWFGTELREQNRRKSEFRGYLAELRSRVERIPHTPDRVRDLFSSYTSFIHGFHRECEKVRRDFKVTDEFDRLSKHLGGLRFEEITNQPKNPRDMIAEAIDQLTNFIDAQQSSGVAAFYQTLTRAWTGRAAAGHDQQSSAMTRHHILRLRCHTLALIIETVGTFFIYMDTVRLNAMVKILGYASFGGEPAKFHAWYYHSAPFGFLLVFGGIILAGICLWLEHASLRTARHSTKASP